MGAATTPPFKEIAPPNNAIVFPGFTEKSGGLIVDSNIGLAIGALGSAKTKVLPLPIMVIRAGFKPNLRLLGYKSLNLFPKSPTPKEVPSLKPILLEEEATNDPPISSFVFGPKIIPFGFMKNNVAPLFLKRPSILDMFCSSYSS